MHSFVFRGIGGVLLAAASTPAKFPAPNWPSYGEARYAGQQHHNNFVHRLAIGEEFHTFTLHMRVLFNIT